MTEILESDRTGKCEGECEDRVREGEDERQAKINDESFDSPDVISGLFVLMDEKFQRKAWA